MKTNKVRFPMASILFILTFLPNISIILTSMSTLFSSSAPVPAQYWILNIWNSICLSLPLVAGILLIMKRRGIGLAAIFSVQVVNALFVCIVFSELNNFLSVLLVVCKDVLMILVILANSDMEYINANYSKLITISKKIWFLPGLIGALGSLGNISAAISLLFSLLSVAAYLMLGKWIVDPYEKQEEIIFEDGSGVSYNDGYCSLGKHIVLLLFTFGIWNLIWIYRTTKYLNKAPNVVQYNPTIKLLLCMFVPFYQIYWLYKHGQRIDVLSKQKKLNNSDMATLCLIFGIFIPIVAYIIMQDRINAICAAKKVGEESNSDGATTEQLKKYKDLLDSGVITKEEFDAKKKQLLGL